MKMYFYRQTHFLVLIPVEYIFVAAESNENDPVHPVEYIFVVAESNENDPVHQISAKNMFEA